MTQAARDLLERFGSLAPQEQKAILLQLLRRTAFADHEFPSEDDLVAAADEVLAELDRGESPG